MNYIVLLINTEQNLICSYGPFPTESAAQNFIDEYLDNASEQGFDMEIVPNKPPIFLVSKLSQ